MSIAEYKEILVLNKDGNYLELHEGDKITLIDFEGADYSGEVYMIDAFDIFLRDVESGEEIEICIEDIEGWENYERRK